MFFFSIRPIPSKTLVISYILRFCLTFRASAATFKSNIPCSASCKSETNLKSGLNYSISSIWGFHQIVLFQIVRSPLPNYTTIFLSYLVVKSPSDFSKRELTSPVPALFTAAATSIPILGVSISFLYSRYFTFADVSPFLYFDFALWTRDI